jgi:hypothetical protein
MTTQLRNRCPFPVLGLLYVGVIGLSAVVGSQIPSLRDLGLPFFGSLFATLIVALVIEIRRSRPNSCPWLDFGSSSRAVLYLALFVVGVAVVVPGIWPTRSVEWPLRIPAILLAISFPALLAIHLRVDHNELEETGVRRSLVFASRLPVYFISTMLALVLLGGVLTFLGVLR